MFAAGVGMSQDVAVSDGTLKIFFLVLAKFELESCLMYRCVG